LTYHNISVIFENIHSDNFEDFK